jgi:hypothetical protein
MALTSWFGCGSCAFRIPFHVIALLAVAVVPTRAQERPAFQLQVDYSSRGMAVGLGRIHGIRHLFEPGQWEGVADND